MLRKKVFIIGVKDGMVAHGSYYKDGKEHLDFPGGGLDGLDIIEAAKKESLEDWVWC